MAEDAESDIVDKNDYREISAKALAVSAKRKLKKNRPTWLVLAESSSEEDEKVIASEEEAVTETESANEIQENVESSYSDDSSADEAKRRKSAEKPKPAHSSSKKSPNQDKRRRRNQINETARVFRKKRWSDSLFQGERRLISLQFLGMLSISLRFHYLWPDMFCTSFSHAKPLRNIHAAREVTLSRF